MKLITYQSKSIKSNNVTFPRWVYDCDTYIHKIIPNGTSAPFKTEELRKNADVINKALGFKYFKDVYTDDSFIYMDMHKLDNIHYNHDIEADVYTLIDIWIDTNLKIFPLCNVDLRELNIMQYKGRSILIDWDDAIQGNKHTAFYIIAELVRHAASFLDKQKVFEYVQHKTQSTCLDLEQEQWNWLIDNFHMGGYNFEKVLHWSEIPSSYLLANH